MRRIKNQEHEMNGKEKKILNMGPILKVFPLKFSLLTLVFKTARVAKNI